MESGLWREAEYKGLTGVWPSLPTSSDRLLYGALPDWKRHIH